MRYAIAAAVALALSAGYLLRAWPLINVVETGRTPEYPEVVPRIYQATPDRVFDAALHAVYRLPRWTLAGYRTEAGEIQAEARTLVLRFVDDVQIRIEPTGSASRVWVRSASRIGRGDFGQNARNIHAFFQELDRQVPGTTHP